jgi:Flp pilus assembly CpaE family ATPase
VAYTAAIAVHLPHEELGPVKAALEDADFEAIPFSNADDLEGLLKRRQDIVLAVFDGERDFDTTIDIYAVLHDHGRSIASLIVVSPATIDRLNIGGGVHFTADWLVRPYDPETLRWRVEALLIRAQTSVVKADIIGGDASAANLKDPEEDPSTGARRGRVVVVFNPKGGVGKTTLAVNVATMLQLKKRERVLLVDCDTVTGHVLPSLGMTELQTVSEIWSAERGRLNRSLAEMARFHTSGVRIVALAREPLHTDVLEPARVQKAIRDCEYSFDWIIADLHPDYGPLNQGIFGLADVIIVPVTPDVPCIRAAIQFRDAAADLEVKDRLVVVVNRADTNSKTKNGKIDAGDVERILGIPSLGRVRSAGMLLVRAANNGHSALEESAKDKVVGDFEKLADKLISARDKQRNKAGSRGGWGNPVRDLLGRLSSS